VPYVFPSVICVFAGCIVGYDVAHYSHCNYPASQCDCTHFFAYMTHLHMLVCRRYPWVWIGMSCIMNWYIYIYIYKLQANYVWITAQSRHRSILQPSRLSQVNWQKVLRQDALTADPLKPVDSSKAGSLRWKKFGELWDAMPCIALQVFAESRGLPLCSLILIIMSW